MSPISLQPHGWKWNISQKSIIPKGNTETTSGDSFLQFIPPSYRCVFLPSARKHCEDSTILSRIFLIFFDRGELFILVKRIIRRSTINPLPRLKILATDYSSFRSKFVISTYGKLEDYSLFRDGSVFAAAVVARLDDLNAWQHASGRGTHRRISVRENNGMVGVKVGEDGAGGIEAERKGAPGPACN